MKVWGGASRGGLADDNARRAVDLAGGLLSINSQTPTLPLLARDAGSTGKQSLSRRLKYGFVPKTWKSEEDGSDNHGLANANRWSICHAQMTLPRPPIFSILGRQRQKQL